MLPETCDTWQQDFQARIISGELDDTTLRKAQKMGETGKLTGLVCSPTDCRSHGLQ